MAEKVDTSTGTATEATNINSLSDKELFTILDALSMEDLMRSELVCKKWQFINEIVFRAKNELSLYVPTYRFELKHFSEVLHWSGRTFATKFEDYALPIHNGNLTRPFCELLVKKFSNVTSFNLFGVRIYMTDFAFLLHHWPNLEQLTLTFGPELPNNWSSLDWNYFWDVIETLSQLKHLALPFRCELDPLYRNVMDRLHSLHVSIGYDFNGNIITKLFDNIRPKLTNLTMTDVYQDLHFRAVRYVAGANYFDLENKFKPILDEKPRAFSQLTHLGWHFRQNSGIDEKLLQFVCHRFTSLTHLDINIDSELTLHEMLPWLYQLKHLTSLRLTPQQRVNIDYEDEDSVYDQSDAEEEALPPLLVQPPNGAAPRLDRRWRKFELLKNNQLGDEPEAMLSPKLENVRNFYIAKVDINDWLDFDLLRFALPNIESITFESCEFPLPLEPRGSNRRKALLQYLRKFSKLKKIYRNNTLLCNLADFDLEKEEDLASAEATLKELFKKRRKIQFFPGVVDPNNVLQDLYQNGEEMEVLLGQLGVEEEVHPDAPIDHEHFDFNYDFGEDIFDGDIEGPDGGEEQQ